MDEQKVAGRSDVRWTEAGLRSIKPTGKREQFSDPTTPGLVLLMTPAGVKTWYLVYRAGGGRTGTKRWFKLGRLGVDLGLTTARSLALKKRGEIASGADPQAERKAARRKVEGLTVNDLCDRFEREYLDGGKVAGSTAVGYKQHLKSAIRPKLGLIEIREVTTAHVAEFLSEIASEAPGQADKVRATLSRMFNRAELWGLRDQMTNPVRGQDRAQSTHRRIRLTNDQVVALGAYLREPREPWQARAFVAILLCTGMRSGEIAGNTSKKISPLPWSDVDLDAGVIRLEHHKSAKSIGTKTVYLCPQVVAYMRSMHRENDLVLGGWKNAAGAWDRCREAIGVPEVRIHDLRHTFTSVGDDLGYSEATRGALVGHTAGTMTARYTHKLSKDLQDAAAAIGGHLWNLLGFH